MVHQNRKKAKIRRNEYANKKATEIKFKVGDPVYYRNHGRKNKLDIKWQPYFRIIEQTSPVTFIIKNQLDGSTSKVHAQHLRLANITEWEIPRDKSGRKLRPSHFVVPPVESESESDTSGSNEDNDRFLMRRYRRERSDSSSEDDIPLAELRDRIRSRKERMEAEEASSPTCRTVFTDLNRSVGHTPKLMSSDVEGKSVNKNDKHLDLCTETRQGVKSGYYSA